MGRIRLVVPIFASLGLLLCVSQEAAAQSSNRLVKPNEEKDDSISRQRARRPQPRPRGPEIFYCETPDTSCRTTQDTFPIADLRDLFVFVVWPGVSGQHVQTVEFLLPGGSIYSLKKTRFSIGSASPVAAMGPAFKNEVSPAPPAPHLIADANKVHPEGIPTLLMNFVGVRDRSEEHTSELQSQSNLVCRLLLEKKKTIQPQFAHMYF